MLPLTSGGGWRWEQDEDITEEGRNKSLGNTTLEGMMSLWKSMP